MEDRAKIITRIKNLLDMANDTSSPNEAAIAARRARSMMDKHQVMLHELGATQDEFEQTPVGKAYKFMPVWKNILAVSVAKFNDCHAIIAYDFENGINKRRIIFRGYRSDVIVASAMYEYLCTTIDRLCAVYTKELGHKSYQAKIGDAYKKGAVNTLIDRLREMMVEREAEMQTATGTSLVVIKTHQVDAHYGATKYVAKPCKTKADDDAQNAVRRGRADGAKISLNTQLRSGSDAKLTA